MTDWRPFRRGYEVERSVAYGEGPRRSLDVYRPSAADGAPVIVFFYGGSWQKGRRETYRFVGAALAKRGFVAMVADYRVFPEVRYPGFIEDGALAVRWASDNAARYGGDPGRLVVMGHSAGAYIAAMLALDERWLEAMRPAPRPRVISGLIGISGPYDFLPLRDGTLKTIFGGASRHETQPIAHVSATAPPTFLATGAMDRMVDPGNSARLFTKLNAAGGDARVATYPGIGHLMAIGAFALPWPLRHLAPVLDDVAGFIDGPAPERTVWRRQPVRLSS